MCFCLIFAGLWGDFLSGAQKGPPGDSQPIGFETIIARTCGCDAVWNFWSGRLAWLPQKHWQSLRLYLMMFRATKRCRGSTWGWTHERKAFFNICALSPNPNLQIFVQCSTLSPLIDTKDTVTLQFCTFHLHIIFRYRVIETNTLQVTISIGNCCLSMAYNSLVFK